MSKKQSHHTKRLDPDGVPVEGRDWTEADWADLHYGMAAIKARIAARHAPKPAAAESETTPTTESPQ